MPRAQDEGPNHLRCVRGKNLPKRIDKTLKEQSSQPIVLARTIQGFLLLGTRMVQQSMRNALSPLLVFMTAELEITTLQKGSLRDAQRLVLPMCVDAMGVPVAQERRARLS
eukprot:Skav233896  [mRNA]  locus=scaffold435:232356:234289:- [translate_table: standard]